MFKSKFEQTIATYYQLRAYETVKIKYTVPATTRTYTPDFPQTDKLFIETKGIWDSTDRKKMLQVIEEHPDKKFILYFQNARTKIHKKSQTTYADFCDKHGIEWYCWRTKQLSKKKLQELKKQYESQ